MKKESKVVAHGWEGLYRLINNCYYPCWHADHFPTLMCRYGGLMGTEGNYRVLFRCGTKAKTFTNLQGEEVPCTGYVDGLTREQVEFLQDAYDTEVAVLAVGPEWPGYDKAKEKVKQSEKAHFYKPA